jgi:hypothetical protein
VTPAQAAFRKTLRASQVQMLRQLAGVRTCVSTAILFRELDTPPLDHIWWSRAVQFWESVRRLAPDNIYYQVLQDNCRDAIARGVRNWANNFLTGLRRIGYPRTIRCDTLISVDPPTVQSLLADQSNTVWRGLSISPRMCPSRGAQLCTYLRWFARPSLLPPRVSALRLPIGVRRLRIFLRCRMGCHGLPVDVGRRTGVPRTQRVCPWCPLQEVARFVADCFDHFQSGGDPS